MVKIDNDIMDIHPIDRMEKLEDIKTEKRSSIMSKKKELEDLERIKLMEIKDLDAKKATELALLEQKKKELEELEIRKLKEIEDTEALIEKSFQDLMRHKRKLLQENEDQEKAKTLDDLTANSPASSIQNIDYGKFFEELQSPTKLYQVTNSGFYSNLKELRDKAARGELTNKEEEFVDQLRNRFGTFQSNAEYMRQDNNNYVMRSMNILAEINQYKASNTKL